MQVNKHITYFNAGSQTFSTSNRDNAADHRQHRLSNLLMAPSGFCRIFLVLCWLARVFYSFLTINDINILHVSFTVQSNMYLLSHGIRKNAHTDLFFCLFLFNFFFVGGWVFCFVLLFNIERVKTSHRKWAMKAPWSHHCYPKPTASSLFSAFTQKPPSWMSTRTKRAIYS